MKRTLGRLLGDSGRTFRRLGDQARDSSDWMVATGFYERHLQRWSADFEIWVQLGHAWKEAGELARAKEAYSRALSLRPFDADLLLNFGRLEVLLGDRKSAFSLFRRSLEVDGNVHANNELRVLVGDAQYSVVEQYGVIQFDEQMHKVLHSGFFDPTWYLDKYPDLCPSYMGALEHFVRHGAFEGRSPGPCFDSEWYIAQNPDIAPVVHARLLNPLLHYVDNGRKEGRKPSPPKTGMYDGVKALIDDILDIDPAFYANSHFRFPKSLPVHDPVPRTNAFKAFKRVFDKLEKSYDYVILVPWLIHGGADLMALNMARAITQNMGTRSVLVVAVDFPRKDAIDWLPSGVDFLSLQDDEVTLSVADTSAALLYLLLSLRPVSVVNVNSMACWEVYRQHGRALSQLMRIYGCAFCRDYNEDDFPCGYADTHVRDTLASLTGLISDNRSFFSTISSHFGFPDDVWSKFIPIYNPPPDLTDRSFRFTRDDINVAHDKEDFIVLWASRYTRQKNIPLLRKIVAATPEIIYEVWGRGDSEVLLREAANEYKNLRVMGPYSSFKALPIGRYSAFLYTSFWDGIPNVLLEAASFGLPIVSSSVGGIRELIDERTGWLIESLDDARPYVASLREIRADKQAANDRCNRMFERLDTQHSWEQFVNVMETSGIVEVER